MYSNGNELDMFGSVEVFGDLRDGVSDLNAFEVRGGVGLDSLERHREGVEEHLPVHVVQVFHVEDVRPILLLPVHY